MLCWIINPNPTHTKIIFQIYTNNTKNVINIIYNVIKIQMFLQICTVSDNKNKN